MTFSTSLWRKIQRTNLTKIDELAEFLDYPPFLNQFLSLKSSFPLNLPLRLAKKISKQTLIQDPIFRQFIPIKEEEIDLGLSSVDPLNEITFTIRDKLIQKYPHRALLLTSSGCAMNCRFCFRRHVNYPQSNFEKELEIIQNRTDLYEIILSGADPLAVDNRIIDFLFDKFSSIEHIKLLRFHTRFPIGIPERIDEGFLKILNQTTKMVWFVIHCNHAIELDTEVIEALNKIQKLGIPVLGQTVLLKGINDNATALKELFLKMITHGIKPYYLHQLDKVKGAMHFEVPIESGLDLMDQLRNQLPGYAIPSFVQEIPGMQSKTILQPCHANIKK